MLPSKIDTSSGLMQVRAWGMLERTNELLVDLGTNGVPGNGYQEKPSWYLVDDDLNIIERLTGWHLREGDKVITVKRFKDWRPRTSCGCI